MLIRMIRRLPALSMDGFDVRHLQLGNLYHVDPQLGRYLIASEYAERVDDSAAEERSPRAVTPKRARVDERCDHCGTVLLLPHVASGFPIPSNADYVCLKCHRAYRWEGTILTVTRSPV
jgi:hypothetical protein